MPHHQTLEIRDFTCFHEASFEFSPGINVFVGENGTGKTHALKLLYAMQQSHYSRGNPFRMIETVFNISWARQLIRSPSDHSEIKGRYEDSSWRGSIRHSFLKETLDLFKERLIEDDPDMSANSESNWVDLYDREFRGTSFGFSGSFGFDVKRPVFIPTQDILGHFRRFVSLYDTYKIDFDSTYRDLATLLGAPEKRELNPYQEEMLALIRGLIGGEFAYKGEGFVLDYGQGEHEAALVAEGHRKLGALALLIRNGMLEPGGTLFWDEPEANVNPTAMDELVTVLLTLARHGVQIFLSTHSYVVLKELDLQGTAADAVRYFAFGKSDEGTRVSSSMDFTTLSPNPILDQYDSLFSRDVQKSLGEPVL